MKKKETSIAEFVHKDSADYAAARKKVYAKSPNTEWVTNSEGKLVPLITPDDLKKEIKLARILGEVNGAERIIASLVGNPDWDRDMLEAKIQIFIYEVLNLVNDVVKGPKENYLKLQDVLETHGYYKNIMEKRWTFLK